MDLSLMAFVAPRPLHLRVAPRGAWRCGVALAFLTVAATVPAQAQVVVGGDRAPSVSVDLTVLDRLGPAPTLPQLFGAARDGATSAAAEPKTARAAKPALHRSSTKRASVGAKKHARTHRVARHKVKRPRLAHAQKPRSVASASKSSVIHLTPPAGMPTAHAARPSRLLPGLAAGVTPASAIAPAPPPASPPLPPLPQATAAPSAPAIAPTQPPEEAPVPPKPETEARDDSAPVSLMAAQPSAEQQPSSNPPAPAPAANPPAPAVVEKPAAAAPPPAPHPAPVQLASSGPSTANTVKFAPGAADLPPNSQAVLDGVAAKLLASDSLRVQLIAHATGDADQAMEARRISLARAVAVRAYLITKGVRSLRMDVRALGNRADDGPASDQVDLVIVSQ